MPYIRIGKRVDKKIKEGAVGEKEYQKTLYSHAKGINEEEKSEFILDAVNEIINSLPVGHKNRSKTFALEIMQKTIEELKDLEIISKHEALRVAKRISGNLEIL